MCEKWHTPAIFSYTICDTEIIMVKWLCIYTTILQPLHETPALADTAVKTCRILLQQSSTGCMTLLMATSTSI